MAKNGTTMPSTYEMDDLKVDNSEGSYTDANINNSPGGVVARHEKLSPIEHDDRVLTRLGKVPVLKRNFAFMSMLGFTCTVMNTWEGELQLFLQSFENGGSAGSIYGYIVVWIGTLCVFATMGELASMAPTSGGQYHWVYMLSPRNCRKFLSYFVGWLAVIGWQSAVAGVAYLSGALIQGVAVMGNPSYEPTAWQKTLLLWASLAFAVFINTVVSSALPKVEGFVLILHVVGFFAVLVPLVYLSPHRNAEQVFTEFMNGGGWQTQGLSFFIGIIAAVFNFLGADGAVHMSEEILNADIIVPRAMVFSVLLNGALGFGILIAILFCLGDVDMALASPTGFPFMTIFEQGVGSVPGAQTMASILVILMLCGTVSVVASASRMTWSFARDRGLPGWVHISKVDPRTSIPIFSVAVTTTISVLLALINIGSSTAFNIIVSLTINGFYGTYFVGNSLILWRRITGQIRPYNRGETGLTNISHDNLSWGPTRIPEPLGTIVNAFGCVYLLIVLFFSFWPTVINPTPDTMNWSSLLFGVTLIFSIVYYVVWAKKVYSGPVLEIDQAVSA
ncbi:amino acid transporter [Xylaria venustula]|nr:amino acid transporter [Xylaria venustula]